MRRQQTKQIFVILGASGAGKSSFLKAGLWPRLERDRNFVPLAMLRPAGGAIAGDRTGLAAALARWFLRAASARPKTPGDLKTKLMTKDLDAASDTFLSLFKTEARIEWVSWHHSQHPPDEERASI
jgi:putative protein kinase ArgK-like GTPase of G3E family